MIVKGIERFFLSGWKYLFILLLFVQCETVSYDFDKFAGVVNWNPEFAVPIGTGSYELWDFIESGNDSDSIFVRQPDDFIHLVYSEDSIFTFDASELVVFPSQQEIDAIEVEAGEFSIDNSSYDATMTLGSLIQAIPALDGLSNADGLYLPFPPLTADDGGTYPIENNELFRRIEISEGFLSLTATNDLSIDINQFSIELYDEVYGSIGVFSFADFAKATSQTQTIDVAGKQISNELKLKIVHFDTGGSSTPILIDFAEKVDFIFETKNIKIKSGNVKIPAQVLTAKKGEYILDAGEGIELYEAAFYSGSLQLTINSTIQCAGEVKISLPATNKDGAPLNIIVPFNKNQTSFTIEEDLANVIMNLASGSSDSFNTIPFTYVVSLNENDCLVELRSDDIISVNITLKDLELEYAKGNFGYQTASMEGSEFYFNSAIFEHLDGDFRLLDPSINLVVKNKDVGVSALINAQFTAYSVEGQPVDLFNSNNQDQGILILKSAAEQNNLWTSQIISINKENSEIVDFIALPPADKITYSGIVEFNAGAEVTIDNPNFITKDAGIIIGMEINLPLQLQTNNLRLLDTIALDNLEIEVLENAQLLVGYKNGLPFNVEMELQFVDTLTHEQFGDAINVELLTSPEVDDEGKAIDMAEGNVKIELTAEDMDNLSKANGVAFEVLISTPKEGDQLKPAKLYATDKLELSFGVIAGVDVSEL